jgi:hypothetical protein
MWRVRNGTPVHCEQIFRVYGPTTRKVLHPECSTRAARVCAGGGCRSGSSGGGERRMRCGGGANRGEVGGGGGGSSGGR